MDSIFKAHLPKAEGVGLSLCVSLNALRVGGMGVKGHSTDRSFSYTRFGFDSRHLHRSESF